MPPVRAVYDSLGLTMTPTVTSEATGFGVRNLFDGNRHTFWKATSAVEQFITFDAGSGATKTVDSVVLARADLLVAATASVDVQWSNDGSTGWTSVGTPFPLTPITTGDLLLPTGRDWVGLPASQTKRAWRLRIYGSLSAVPSLSGLWLGARYEWPARPRYGLRYGVARAHQGAPLEVQWGLLAEAEATDLLTYLATVTEGLGPRPHYLYDAVGTLFRHQTAPAPYLLPVICTLPADVVSTTIIRGTVEGPAISYLEIT